MGLGVDNLRPAPFLYVEMVNSCLISMLCGFPSSELLRTKLVFSAVTAGHAGRKEKLKVCNEV